MAPRARVVIVGALSDLDTLASGWEYLVAAGRAGGQPADAPGRPPAADDAADDPRASPDRASHDQGSTP